MDFCKTIYCNKIIFTVKSEIIDDNICASIISELSENEKAGINMEHVNKIEGKKFTEYLIKNRYKLFNMQSEVLAYLSIILKDGLLKTFMNKEDFIKNKRELIRRRFVVV